jgi:hypothetical protein
VSTMDQQTQVTFFYDYDEMKKRLYYHLVHEGRTLFMGSPMGCFYMSMYNDVPMVSREGCKIDAGNSCYYRCWRLQIPSC